MRVLISGASVAGPVLAYWLRHYGYTPTVVEKSPTLRKTGGHAVDLFRPAMDIIERMGLVDAVRAHRTDIERMTIHRQGVAGAIEVDLRRMMSAVSDSHVEIMRDELSEIIYDATRDDVEYVFDDSISSLTPDEDGVEVRFTRSSPRRFDLVIGADGLHSNVRALVFGPEADYTNFLGTYLAVLTAPHDPDLDGRLLLHGAPGRLAGLYPAKHTGDARGVFLFRTTELDYHHRDTARQKLLLRQVFTGMGGIVPGLLARLDDTEAFYFDSITQLRMHTWTRGRVSLVGDAGYCPGPAVGGSTSLAVVGAYVLAGELAAAGGDHQAGLAAYEAELGAYVRASRAFAVGVARRLVPNTRAQLWALARGAWLAGQLPSSLTRAVAKLNRGGVRMHDEVQLKTYANRPRTQA